VGNARRQLILVGGAQRSGTTLLQTLLANALDAPVLPEAHILCDVMASYKRAKDAGKKTRFYYEDEQELLGFFRFCADRHIADLEHLGGSALVLKDPNFVQFDAETAALFPQAIRIVSLRDPRDIAASFLRIGQREPREGEAGKYRRRDVHFIAKKILVSYAPLMGGPPPQRAFLVRYEQLAVEPKATLEALARESGLPLSLAQIANPVWLEAEARHDASWVSELEEQGPSAASVGSYAAVMRPREIALVEQICAPVMAWAGYEPSYFKRGGSEWPPTRIAREALSRVKRGYWSYRARFSQF
jgi:hypothetical protein